MRRYLLDSGPLAGFLNGRPAAVGMIGPWIVQREVATSILVYAEVTEYLRSLSNSASRQADLRQLLRSVYPYFLTYRILERGLKTTVITLKR